MKPTLCGPISQERPHAAGERGHAERLAAGGERRIGAPLLQDFPSDLLDLEKRTAPLGDRKVRPQPGTVALTDGPVEPALHLRGR